MATTTVAKQSRVQVNIYEQTDIATVAPGGSPAMKTHLVDSDLAPRQDLIDSPEVNASRQATEPFLDALDVAGGLTILADPIGIGWYLKWLMGAPVTTGAGPYTHTFKVLTAQLTPLTIEKILIDIAQVWRFFGCKLNRFSFDVARGGLLTVPFDITAVGVVEATAAIDAAPFYPAGVVFRVPTITMTEAGVAFARATRFAAQLDNNNEGIATLGNNGQFYDIIEGIARPTGTLSMLLADRAIYDKAKVGTESALAVTFPASDGASSLVLSWPEVKYALHAPQFRGGTGPVNVDVAWRGYFGNDAAGSEMVAVLVNTHASYAAAIPA